MGDIVCRDGARNGRARGGRQGIGNRRVTKDRRKLWRKERQWIGNKSVDDGASAGIEEKNGKG